MPHDTTSDNCSLSGRGTFARTSQHQLIQEQIREIDTKLTDVFLANPHMTSKIEEVHRQVQAENLLSETETQEASNECRTEHTSTAELVPHSDNPDRPEGLGRQSAQSQPLYLSPDDSNAASIPISVPNHSEQQEGDGSESEDEGRSIRGYAELLLRLAALAGIICGLYFAGQAIGSAIEKLRDGMQEVPVWAFSLGLLLVNFFRFSFPPAYFVFPVGTISTLFYGDAMGTTKGALLMKFLELINAAAFLVCRRLYSAGIKDLFETGETSLSRAMPGAIRQGLRHFDVGWRHWVLDKPWWQQLPVMVAMQTAFYMDDLVTILWLATRSEVSFARYCVALVLFIGADFPRKVLQMETVLATSDALSSGGNFLLEFFEAFGNMPAWQTVCIILFSVSSTVFVHGRNLFIVYNLLRKCCGCGGPEEPEEGERAFNAVAENGGHLEGVNEGAGDSQPGNRHDVDNGDHHDVANLDRGVLDIENSVQQRDGPAGGVEVVQGVAKPGGIVSEADGVFGGRNTMA